MKGNAFKSDKLKENNRFSVLKEESINKDLRRDDRRDERRDDRRDERRDDRRDERKFFTNDNPKKDIMPILNELNFPSFCEKNELALENNPEINYSNAIRSENNEINVVKVVEVLPGWVKISKSSSSKDGSNGYSNFEYGISTIIEPIEPSFNDQMTEVINNMNEKWENYKEDYINLYGIDEYEKNHLMLNHELDYDSDYE
jgi:hypothetical protein